MPNHCCVCFNNSLKDRKEGKACSYYRIPAVVSNQGFEGQELSKERRKSWLKATWYLHATEDEIQNLTVCSKPFHNGAPARLFEKTNPDWKPSQKLDCTQFFDDSADAGNSSAVVERYERAKKRRLQRESEQDSKVKEDGEKLAALQYDNDDNGEAAEGYRDTGDDGICVCGCQESSNDQEVPRCVSCCDCKTQVKLLKEKLELLEIENTTLKGKVAELTKHLGRGERLKDESDFADDEEKVSYYTGLPNFVILMGIFDLIKPGISKHASNLLSPFQKFIITLMRLRLNLQMQDLAYRYTVSLSTISRAFTEILDLLHVNLSKAIMWPEREDLIKSMPLSFRRDYGTKVVSIIDCFEVFIERPSNLYARAQTFSQYKHHNTAKYLISITPQGSVSFISDGWGGRVSDKHLTSKSGFLKKLLPGDVVLADRGFDIDELLGSIGCTLKIPAFTKGKPQLSPQEVCKSRSLSNVRIHVERVIGSVRQKYTVLESTIPITLLKKNHPEDIPKLDKVVVVACALTNLCPPIVSANG